jgi:hypothetical protein
MPTADPLFALFGRLHVVAVHLPIGAAAALVAAETAALLRRRPGPHAASFALSATGALTAAAAVVTGFAFSEARPGDFAPHRDAGLATAAAFVAATALARVAFGGRRIAAFRAAVLCAAAATGLAAWRGFALTHAEAAAAVLPGEGGDVVAVVAEAEPPACRRGGAARRAGPRRTARRDGRRLVARLRTARGRARRRGVGGAPEAARSLCRRRGVRPHPGRRGDAARRGVLPPAATARSVRRPPRARSAGGARTPPGAANDGAGRFGSGGRRGRDSVGTAGPPTRLRVRRGNFRPRARVPPPPPGTRRRRVRSGRASAHGRRRGLTISF